MTSLCVTLAARLLPTAVLAVAGWAMSAGPASHSHAHPPASSHPSVNAADAPRYAKPPAACATISPGTVRRLVPGANTAGTQLATSDATRRTGCSWHALKGFDYRWLDVTVEVFAPATGPKPHSADEVAGAVYAGRKKGGAVTGLGAEASVDTQLTKEDGQPTRTTEVVVRSANAVVSVTYSGSNFETGNAPGEGTVRDGGLAAARDAVGALDDGGP